MYIYIHTHIYIMMAKNTTKFQVLRVSCKLIYNLQLHNDRN